MSDQTEATVDLAPFKKANEKGVGTKAAERMRLIRKEFPVVYELDWKRAFDQDLDLFARVVRDILKLDQAVPGKPGPRLDPEYDRALVHLRQLMGQDYTMLSFVEAFGVLADGRSLTQLARKVGLSRTQVRRLRMGWKVPSLYEMSQIADAYGKHASFFVEYRIAYITGALATRLASAPESSIGLYRKLLVGTGA
jgi:DNA-binding phage protein